MNLFGILDVSPLGGSPAPGSTPGTAAPSSALLQERGWNGISSVLLVRDVAGRMLPGSRGMEEQRQGDGRWRGKGQVGESRAGREKQI